MIEGGPEQPTPPPSRSLADLTVPRRPAGVPYEEGEDHDARALLIVNGYSTKAEELIGLLDSHLGILVGAAARTLGANEERSAIGDLERVARDTGIEETARVQASFALARMGVAGARDMLVRLLDLPMETSPAPLQAAGALARLGDPRGFVMVRSALDSANRVIAMVGCKQLFNFAALDDRQLPAGGRVALFSAFRRALKRSEPNIAAEARRQLEELDSEAARMLLEQHTLPRCPE